MFDFLIDIVPRDEIQVKPTKKQVRQSTAPCMPHQCNMRNLVSCVGLLFCSVLLPPLSSSSHPHLMPSTHLLHSTPHYFFHSNCVSHLLLTPPPPPSPFSTTIRLTPHLSCRKRTTLFSQPSSFSYSFSSLRANSRGRGKWPLLPLSSTPPKRTTNSSSQRSPPRPWGQAPTRPHWRPCTNCCSYSCFSSSSMPLRHNRRAQSKQ